MAHVILVPGAGSDSWHWHRVVPRLADRGHSARAVDLPCGDPEAGLDVYADHVRAAIDQRPAGAEVAVVAQSMGGLSAPLACADRPVSLLVLVAAMIPRPGETGNEWWSATDQAGAQRAAAVAAGRDPDAPSDPVELYCHDVPADVVAASAEHDLDQSERPFDDPWPLRAWPDVPTLVVAGAHDRLFPLAMQRRVAAERLGLDVWVVPSGHLPALAVPERLAAVVADALAVAGGSGAPSIDGAVIDGVAHGQALLPAPTNEVWAALAGPARLAGWLGHVTAGDVGPDAPFSLQHDDGIHSDHRVVAWEPGRRLRLTWEMADEPAGEVELRLSPLGAGSLVVVEHHGLADPDGQVTGWTDRLARLAAVVTGAPPRPPGAS